jgi:hypothetical protein
MSSTPAAPGGTRPITVTLTGGPFDEPIGSCAAHLVLTCPGQATDPAAWAITHALGSPAGGTHTEVVFVDDTLVAAVTSRGLDRLADDLVRQVADALYGRTWAFHYRPDRVEDSVLRYGSLLRERVEITDIEVWS